MDLEFNEDQQLIVQAFERWAADHMEIPTSFQAPAYLPGDALAEDLAEQGYLDIASQPEYGAMGAVLLIEAVTRTPWAIEVAASSLIAPMLGLEGLPRPLAVMDGSNPVTRFLAPGGAALIDAGDHVRLLRCDERVEPVTNLYPYPFGKFEGDLIEASERLNSVSVQDLRTWRTLATVAEALGTMESALNITVDYVRTRVQFKRPIGAFQSVQHKLAECASLIHGARLLIYRAATMGEGVDNAAHFTHDAAARVALEATQFHGAIGQTLEFHAHHWIYRLRILQFELHTALKLMPVAGAMAV